MDSLCWLLMQYFTSISACLALMAAACVPCSHILMFDFNCGSFLCNLPIWRDGVFWLTAETNKVTSGAPNYEQYVCEASLRIHLCRPWIIWEICCKTLMNRKGHQASCFFFVFFSDFQLPVMVALTHAGMQWPFYLSFIPGCIWVSGRRISWCRKHCPTIMAQLLPPWTVFANAGGLVDKVVEQRLGMGGREVLVTVIHHSNY